MAITEVTMYRAVCDHCGVSAQDGSDYWAWSDPDIAADEANNSDWVQDGDVLVCPDCVERDRICPYPEDGDDCDRVACEVSA